eukprot:7375996-Prymnesium_polylepis.1
MAGDSPSSLDNKTFVSYGRLDDASSCQAACAADTSRGCSIYTWHDSEQGVWANQCIGRLDGQWSLRAEQGHTSGHVLTPDNVWVADIAGQVDDVPGLQVDGVRATRARYPVSRRTAIRRPRAAQTNFERLTARVGPSAEPAGWHRSEPGIRLDDPIGQRRLDAARDEQ